MTRVIKGSSNVFKDLGFSQAKEIQAKAELTRQIYNIIKERHLTQTTAAELLGLAQPDVSNLMRGRFTGFSTDRLLQILNALDNDIEIIIRQRKRNTRRPAGIKVVRAA